MILYDFNMIYHMSHVLRCTFAGHRLCPNKIYDNLYNETEKLINSGVCEFLVGTHGEFDKMAYKVCLSLREIYPHIKISLVLTNLNLNKDDEYFYKSMNIERFSYEIEQFHYKQRITKSNEFMVDDVDFVIAYVDEDINSSGAYKTLKYAKKKNKTIINLFNS